MQLLWLRFHLHLGPAHDGPRGPRPSDHFPGSQGDPVARANVVTVGCGIEHTDRALLPLDGETVGFAGHARQLCQHEWVQLPNVRFGH